MNSRPTCQLLSAIYEEFRMSLKSHVFKPFRIDAIKQEESSCILAKNFQQIQRAAEAEDFPALRSYDKYAAVKSYTLQARVMFLSICYFQKYVKTSFRLKVKNERFALEMILRGRLFSKIVC